MPRWLLPATFGVKLGGPAPAKDLELEKQAENAQETLVILAPVGVPQKSETTAPLKVQEEQPLHAGQEASGAKATAEEGEIKGQDRLTRTAWLTEGWQALAGMHGIDNFMRHLPRDDIKIIRRAAVELAPRLHAGP
ncbi:unnamed protein product [Prorocentrum cordatum]|uniref:Uncharacterized protein n=1 Tax=Prorocentrum cordatum TaxID=2364126 RepID=A0ABN9VR07_9DINO|nr:unnamed protein product [Polarella glacialis]